jgi:hypothetical protein
MNTHKLKAERMKFLFILDRNTYATYTCRVPFRTAAILLIILILALQKVLWKEFIQMSHAVANDTFAVAYQLIQVLIWLLMLAGPITQNFDLCYVGVYILEIAAFVEFASKLLIYVECARVLFPPKTTIFYLYVFIGYFEFWFGAVYIYYSYTKSLGLGLLINEAGDQSSMLA